MKFTSIWFVFSKGRNPRAYWVRQDRMNPLQSYFLKQKTKTNQSWESEHFQCEKLKSSFHQIATLKEKRSTVKENTVFKNPSLCRRSWGPMKNCARERAGGASLYSKPLSRTQQVVTRDSINPFFHAHLPLSFLSFFVFNRHSAPILHIPCFQENNRVCSVLSGLQKWQGWGGVGFGFHLYFYVDLGCHPSMRNPTSSVS